MSEEMVALFSERPAPIARKVPSPSPDRPFTHVMPMAKKRGEIAKMTTLPWLEDSPDGSVETSSPSITPLPSPEPPAPIPETPVTTPAPSGQMLPPEAIFINRTRPLRKQEPESYSDVRAMLLVPQPERGFLDCLLTPFRAVRRGIRSFVGRRRASVAPE
jgi:hypothetical protein